MLYFDKIGNKLIISWVDEQHMGHLVGASPILCLDMWEHSYYLDYIPSEKKKYIEAFFANLNWEVIENNFNSCF
jgi:Fe-Mn family superoxide dismutase